MGRLESCRDEMECIYAEKMKMKFGASTALGFGVIVEEVCVGLGASLVFFPLQSSSFRCSLFLPPPPPPFLPSMADWCKKWTFPEMKEAIQSRPSYSAADHKAVKEHINNELIYCKEDFSKEQIAELKQLNDKRLPA